MRPYAVLTVLLYVCILFVLAVPAAQIFYGWEIGSEAGGLEGFMDAARDLLEICTDGYVVVWILVMAAGQASLLLVPVAGAERRLATQKDVLIAVIISAFFLSLLDASSMLSIAMAIWGDKVFGLGWWIVVGVLVLWAIWALTFYSFSLSIHPNSLNQRLVNWLFAGGTIEIMVTVPCLLITRVNDVVMAPDVIFLMIILGFWTMLMALGPGVFSMFVSRYLRLNPDE